MPRQAIYKKGLSLVPWQNDLFWVGSTYEWDHTHLDPTPAFREQTEKQLQQWLKLPYKVLDHWAAERPANLERRPFVGLHPWLSTVGLFNGLGTKGCSLAPYFAHAFAAFLAEGKPLEPAVGLERFRRILSQ
ncbi:MAG: FAD-dependent oxidoreductase [Sphingobacteriia bacterium]|nr:MAG: FAD-dependent oxidoreductase [Sphingobacteriia bacterium]